MTTAAAPTTRMERSQTRMCFCRASIKDLPSAIAISRKWESREEGINALGRSRPGAALRYVNGAVARIRDEGTAAILKGGPLCRVPLSVIDAGLRSGVSFLMVSAQGLEPWTL